MKILKIFFLQMLLLQIIFNCNSFGQKKSEKIFQFKDEHNTVMNLEQKKYYQKIKESKSFRKISLINFTLTKFDLSDIIEITLFENKNHKFEIKKIKKVDPITIFIVGEENNNRLYFTQRPGGITGTISVNNKQFSLIPLGENLHALIEIDQLKYKMEEEPIKPPILDYKYKLNSIEKKQSVSSSNNIIDVLVAYTPAADNAVSDIVGLIQNAINVANYSFNGDDIDIEYNLVLTPVFDYSESGKTMPTVLDDFSNNSSIKNLRDEYNADLCFLVTNGAGFSGISWFVEFPSSYSSAFGYGLGNYNRVRDTYIFSHETGHNLGARHNKEEDGDGTYNHGYLYSIGSWCTIMSYYTTETRQNMWSNPDKYWNGVIRGNTAYADNSRKLSETNSAVSNYRTVQLIGTLSENQTFSGRTFSLEGNLIVPSGKILKIKSNATVKLGNYYIKSTGGTIVLESGSTITGLKAYLKYYSTLKGFFPSAASAVSNAGSNRQAELLANTTYNENISISNKYNVDLKGASNGTSVVNGNITITNSNYSSVYNVKMHNGHKITINGGSHSDVSNVYYINTTDAVYFYNGYLNDLLSTTINSGGGQVPACYFYNTTSDVGDIDINDGYDFAVYSTNNASLTVGSGSYFCNNMIDLYATSGGYIYGYNNTMSAPWPMSVAGNVSGYSPYSCTQQMAKSNTLNKNSDDQPLSAELNTLNVEYAELNHTISTENEEKTPEVMDNYKSNFDALIVDYKALLNEKSEAVEVTGILSKIEKCYYATGDEDDFETYIKSLLAEKAYADVYPYIERYYSNLHLSRGEYKEAV